MKFAWKAPYHESDVICYMFEQTLESKQSVLFFYQNVEYCCSHTNFSQGMLYKSFTSYMQLKRICPKKCKTDENYAKVNLIKELR